MLEGLVTAVVEAVARFQGQAAKYLPQGRVGGAFAGQAQVQPCHRQGRAGVDAKARLPVLRVAGVQFVLHLGAVVAEGLQGGADLPFGLGEQAPRHGAVEVGMVPFPVEAHVGQDVAAQLALDAFHGHRQAKIFLRQGGH